ncbi:hypothetical protein [Frondihabitans cladoniiphilus]|uniref:Uncharacterized protein n=1 Tax=Frondihabitans cladoniiphilus TaxID=715785 RepID=A0ABP8W4S9_9MICO
MTFSQPYPDSGPSYPAKAGPVTPPRFVNIAFYLFLLVALVKLVAIVVSIASFGTVAAQARDRVSAQVAGTSLTQAQAETIIRGSLVTGIVLSIVFLVLFVVFDLVMRRGANWARIVLLILTVLSLSAVTGAYGLGALATVAGIVATVLMFLTPSNAYFREVKGRKLAARGQIPGGPGAYPPPAAQ